MSNYKFTTLGKAAQFINGFAFKPEDWESEGVPIIRIQNLTDSTKLYNYTTKKVPNQYIVKPGDLLVSWSATLDVYEWTEKNEAYLNQHIFKVVPEANRVYQPYLKYAIKSAIDSMSKYTHGSTMKHINRGEFLSTEIPLPPLPEQKHIAAVLDKANAIRRKRQETIRLLDEFLRSLFLEMFGDPVRNEEGWDSVQLDDVLERIESGWSPVCLDRTAIDDEWGVLKLGAVTSGIYKDQENKALPETIIPKPELEVHPGDVLFTRKNTYDLVAASTYVFKSRKKLMISDLIFRLVIKNKIQLNPVYLWGVLSNSKKRTQIQRLAGGTAGSMPNISKSNLLNVQIPLPPITLQNKFALIIEQTEQQKRLLEKSLYEMENNFSSMMQIEFRGEL